MARPLHHRRPRRTAPTPARPRRQHRVAGGAAAGTPAALIPAKGPWPSPRVDAIEATAAKYAADRPAWGLRRQVFRDPPTVRDRVWQLDFSGIETAAGGIWRLCAVIDFVTEYCLALTVTPTSRGADAVACVERAVAHAQRLLGLPDLRADRGSVDVVERSFGTPKYDHLYRTRLTDGDALAVECSLFRQTCNTRRPHQGIGDRIPRTTYLSSLRT
ncbi:hypothetical protein [Kineococcus esterisolvens]|uniref:hypothetical protein n=1 Tax=unclassified Kineococcus TaxID=2621656 RepID=UPI003D7D829F